MADVETRLRFSATNQTNAAFTDIARGYDQMARQAAQSARSQSAHMEGMRLAAARFSGSLLGVRRRLGAAAAAFVGGEVARRSFMEFAENERRFTRLGITTEATKGQIGSARKELYKYAQSTGQSYNEIVKGAEALAQATGQSLPSVVELTKDLAIANNALGGSMEDTSKTAEVMLNTLKVKPDQMMKGFAMIGEAAREGKFEAQDLAHYIPSLAADFAAAGYSGAAGLSTMLALLVNIRRQTGNSEQAANALRDAMSKMNTEETAKNFLKAGVELGPAMNKVRREGGDVMAAFADATDLALTNIAKANNIPLEKKASQLSKLFPEIDSRRAMTAILQLNKEVGVLQYNLQGTSVESLQERNKKVLEDAQASVVRMGNAWDSAKRSFGEFMANLGTATALDFVSEKLDLLSKNLQGLERRMLIFASNPALASARAIKNVGMMARARDEAKILETEQDKLIAKLEERAKMEETIERRREKGQPIAGYEAEAKRMDQGIAAQQKRVEERHASLADVLERQKKIYDEQEKADEQTYKDVQQFRSGIVGQTVDARRQGKIQAFTAREQGRGIDRPIELPEPAEIRPTREAAEEVRAAVMAERERLDKVAPQRRGIEWQRASELNKQNLQRVEGVLNELKLNSPTDLGSATEDTARRHIDETVINKGLLQKMGGELSDIRKLLGKPETTPEEDAGITKASLTRRGAAGAEAEDEGEGEGVPRSLIHRAALTSEDLDAGTGARRLIPGGGRRGAAGTGAAAPGGAAPGEGEAPVAPEAPATTPSAPTAPTGPRRGPSEAPGAGGAAGAPATAPAAPSAPTAPTGPRTRGGTAPAGGGGSRPTPAGEAQRIAVAKAAFKDQLRKEGVPESNLEEAANLLAGQALQESGLGPTKTHDVDKRTGKPTGYGIYGARLERRDRMIAWMKQQGYGPESLEGQAKYMAHEAMTRKEYARSRAALMGATEANRARGTQTLIENFERPQDQGPKQLRDRLAQTRKAAGVRADAGAPAAPAATAPDGTATTAPTTPTAATVPTAPAGPARGGQPGGGDREIAGGAMRPDPSFKPKGLLVHHTGGRGTPESVNADMRRRGLGVQYMIDREGNIVSIAPGRQQSHGGSLERGKGFSNRSLEGVEVLAKDERDVTDAQRKAIGRLYQQRKQAYGWQPGSIWGHGELTRRKQPTEGATARAIREQELSGRTAAAPAAQAPAPAPGPATPAPGPVAAPEIPTRKVPTTREPAPTEAPAPAPAEEAPAPRRRRGEDEPIEARAPQLDLPSEHTVKVNYDMANLPAIRERGESDARHRMQREMNSARWNSLSDVGVA